MFENVSLPKTAAGWVALVVFVALAGLGVWQATNGNWTATVIAALGAIGTAINKGVWPKASIMLAGILVLGTTACGGAGWRAAYAVRSAGDLTDKAITAAVNNAAEKCQADGETGDNLAPCVRKSKAWEAQTHWRKYAVPSINSSIIATVTALQLADKAKKEIDWKEALKEGVCALAKIVKQWGDLLGSFKPAISAASIVEGITCK